MKKIIFLLTIIIISAHTSDAQLFKKVKSFLSSQNTGLTEKDAAAGIREALEKGTDNSVKLVSVVDGYWGNPEIKIPFPPETKDMETKLRAIGLGKKVDEFNLSMNRAAEKAANEAKPIFIAAIKGMTITDAINIVRGPDNAATMYLQRTTTPELTMKFQPVIRESLEAVDATRYWSDLINVYNKIPFVKKMNPDLAAYVTEKAIDGLFVMIAKEELNIRKDPVARTTELLRKVFGNK